jgi:hypothetical protein
MQYVYVPPTNDRFLNEGELLIYKRFDSAQDAINFYTNPEVIMQIAKEGKENAINHGNRRSRGLQVSDSPPTTMTLTLINSEIRNTSKLQVSSEGTPDSIFDMGGSANILKVVNSSFHDNKWNADNEVSAMSS